jgi:uncharacterized protein YaaN involved in tellurite resistance
MEKRFDRLELRVDEIKDSVSEIKADMKIQNHSIEGLKIDLKDYTIEVKNHVAGDEKIITELQPLFDVLPQLQKIANDHSFREESGKRNIELIKKWSLRFGFILTVAGVLQLASTYLPKILSP